MAHHFDPCARRRRNLLLRSSILLALGAACGGVTTVDDRAADNIPPVPPFTPGSEPIASDVCQGATAILQRDGSESGYARCPDGTVHRYAALACDLGVVTAACSGDESIVDCVADSDCTAMPHGVCRSREACGNLGCETHCGCLYPCETDGDCGAGYACVCDGVLPGESGRSLCEPAGCSQSGDCETGECGVSSYHDGCFQQSALACRTSADPCRFDGECERFGACAVEATEEGWQCALTDCVSGRPLMVAGHARTAAARTRDDWRAELRPRLEGLASDLRAALAEHWHAAAALEHASVASFARFSLQLLALGAPPDLLRAAQDAGNDEIEHARAAYALASAYAGRRIGPGALDLRGVTLDTDPCAVAAEIVREACAGETLAAAEAAELATLVVDPCLRDLYQRIAEEEQRHAELGWRALAWLLAGGGAAVREAARAALATALAASSSDPRGPARASVEHGLLSGRDLGALRRQVLREVVAPCAERLVGIERSSS